MLFGVLLIVAYANGAAIVSVKIVNEISMCVFVCAFACKYKYYIRFVKLE